MDKKVMFESFLDKMEKSGANKESIDKIRNGFRAVIEAKEAESKSKFSSLKELAIDLLYDAQQFHIWHLNCGLIAEHMALQDVYEFMVDFSDDIAEAIIGIEDAIIESQKKSFSVEKFAYDKTTAVSKLEATKDAIQKSIDSLKNQDGIVNILADGIQQIDKFIYKLKRFE